MHLERRSILRGLSRRDGGEARGLTLALRRADLHEALLGALETDTARLYAEFRRFEQDEEAIVARFAGGRSVRGDFLVRADGFPSTVRARRSWAMQPTRCPPTLTRVPARP